MKPQVIAFYLPQFYPFPENDMWWGKGFTEWTNVGKAKPLFKGHNQPRVPTELGYYDLRLPIIREQQAQMARDAGVTAFCYWHYWLGGGRRLLPKVFDEVLETGKPDFPFCLGWANHSWFSKNWNANGTTSQKTLIEQTYPGKEDQIEHFKFLKKAFKDERYLKIDNSPVFYIFDPFDVPSDYIINLKKWTQEEGFNDLFLIGNIKSEKKNQTSVDLMRRGFTAVSYERLPTQFHKLKFKGHERLIKYMYELKGFFVRRPPRMRDYRRCYTDLITSIEKGNDVIPQIVPQWDHTPRSGFNGNLFIHATPDYFYLHVKDALEAIRNKPQSRQILLLKSWNEWGEGNMMEPDLTYGRGFIEALHKAIEEYDKQS